MVQAFICKNSKHHFVSLIEYDTEHIMLYCFSPMTTQWLPPLIWGPGAKHVIVCGQNLFTGAICQVTPSARRHGDVSTGDDDVCHSLSCVTLLSHVTLRSPGPQCCETLRICNFAPLVSASKQGMSRLLFCHNVSTACHDIWRPEALMLCENSNALRHK